ncbi:cupin domain-containing protein [Endozoicomonas sp. SM1973]|uniref:Cupin domain-containing protein n=1 Tax=Spartinivicinus marinus TaxID=2994442 RepID=A0A853I802_9GAMM|nr:cupin domain-containing protein [Spartinivicinus marinus]MCX4026877.1 cupin domain-containing protein [Spartinivicinus marinus]NYZ66778.1 cupin domain-containing protein [Spartinivicinus marinus]
MEDVIIWNNYFGLLFDDSKSNFPSRLFGYQTFDKSQPITVKIDNAGACFGYVYAGQLTVLDNLVSWQLQREQWFHIPAGCQLILQPFSKVVICQRLGYRGMHIMGGPIEQTGRLRYIDGCTDSLLCSPPLAGDPCLNLLHFPTNITQTQHTHPSVRAGMIVRGCGVCCTEKDTIELHEGMIFIIPTGAVHNFKTTQQSMDVIAYHPDSDWGPTHEEHPMINRTWVGGKKIVN